MAKYYTKISDEDGNEFLLAVNITRHGAPTEDTEAEPGMCYLDEDSEHGDLYKCIGVLVTETRTVYRWKKLAGQEEVERLSEAIAELDVQPDWNQNDETAKDYVKNRPFWTDDPTETALLKKQTVNVMNNGGIAFCIISPVNFIIRPNEEYTVNFDEVSYKCIPFESEGILILGNGKLMGQEQGNDEPFLFYIDGNGFLVSSDGLHTIEIIGVAEKVVQLDKKYLPDAVVLYDTLFENNLIPTDKMFPLCRNVFGSSITDGGTYSTLESPRPNKFTLSNLSLERFNAMLNGTISVPPYVFIGNSIAQVIVRPTYSQIQVIWTEYNFIHKNGYTDVAGANIVVYDAEIHEDSDNPGAVVSEYAMIKVASKDLE